ncbi:MAG: hypothetical protein ACXAC8_08545 [Candidatus Hodarchaeales archaeon]|jgi:hypothetical protein
MMRGENSSENQCLTFSKEKIIKLNSLFQPMSEGKALDGTSITDGLIITILQDAGPENIYDSSPLSESESYNMVFKTISAIGSDVRTGMEFGEIRSFGPMPTGKEPYLTLAFIFFLPTTQSKDERLLLFGRLIAFWIITRSTSAIKYIGIIKRTIRRILQMYRIKNAEDLLNDTLLPKINEKLHIIESGLETLYLTDGGQLESFFDLSLTPAFSPIVLIDKPHKEVNILLRKETPAIERNLLLNLVNDYKSKFPKGSLYKAKIITDPMFVQSLLSKAGFYQEAIPKVPFQVDFSDQLTYRKLDFLIDDILFLRKNQLIKLLLEAVKNQNPINIKKLASDSEFPQNFIQEILNKAKKEGFFFEFLNEND